MNVRKKKKVNMCTTLFIHFCFLNFRTGSCCLVQEAKILELLFVQLMACGVFLLTHGPILKP